MERAPIINRDIQVDSVSSKQASTGNMKWIIVDSNRVKYFFWQKNNGVDCEVYKNFTSMGVKKGDVIYIGFTESPESFVNKEGNSQLYRPLYPRYQGGFSGQYLGPGSKSRLCGSYAVTRAS